MTHDAGATWSVVTEALPLLAKVACAGDRDFWIAGGDGTLFHSPDVGATWREETSGLNRPGIGLIAIAFQSRLEGWVAGDGLVAFHTVDGGQHWTPHGIVGTTGFVSVSDGGLAFDGQHGVVVVQDLHPFTLPPARSSFGVTFATFDAGQTWTETVLPEGINAIWDVSLIR